MERTLTRACCWAGFVSDIDTRTGKPFQDASLQATNLNTITAHFGGERATHDAVR